jgi:hypothetical protein
MVLARDGCDARAAADGAEADEEGSLVEALSAEELLELSR